MIAPIYRPAKQQAFAGCYIAILGTPYRNTKEASLRPSFAGEETELNMAASHRCPAKRCEIRDLYLGLSDCRVSKKACITREREPGTRKAKALWTREGHLEFPCDWDPSTSPRPP